ncbi:hypothetical protein B0H63DRAFT_456650 [Podospora didyma]|uniref:Monooxygenase n=1 Tax=Podospora didyma TaxID=330526 RepID=A0AAE0U6L5_9PEZI|nr:hypothetical protein B0H63DRAFT_456650 [Podospora didyma]
MAATESVLDVLIIGAGLSGINAAYRLQTEMPGRSFAIVDSRDAIGGTWDFWKYPGFRTDSAMALFGFSWYPWPHVVSMAEGPQIQKYIEDAAAAEGIDKKIRFRNRVTAASWSTNEQRWTVSVDVRQKDGSVEKQVLKVSWLIGAGGYYDYEKPLQVTIPGIERFGGEVVHPQFWGDEVSYDGKRVVIIGSGATAVTLLPSLAKTAKSVTMLQRSPSYVASRPRKDYGFPWLEKFLPLSWTRTLNWWRRMFIETFAVWLLYTFPNFGRKGLVEGMRRQLPKSFDVDKHFNPRYDPFTQRLCFCPGGDFFKALNQPNAHVVTDIIETVTETGIQLKSGETLEADMIITATGLYLVLLSGIVMTVDDVRVDQDLGKRFIWNSVMLEGIPNAGVVHGYTAATWTPGADVRTRKMFKVMRRMDELGASSAMPYLGEEERVKLPQKPALNLSSTYIVTARDRVPMSAGVGPWRMGNNWLSDVLNLNFGSMAGIQYGTADKSKDD